MEDFGRQSSSKYECLLFDVDDTLYPMSAGLNLACAKNIQEYMSQKLNIEASQVPKMCLDLYREYGTTMAGLKALGYEFGNDEFHAYVHGRLPYERLKIDSGLRNLLMSMPQRKIVLQLLKQSLISKTPMNDVFLKKQEVPVFPVKPNEAKVKLEPSQAPVKLEPLEAEQVKLEQPFLYPL